LAVELVARDYDQGWESLAELRDRLATHLPDGVNLFEADRHATLRACFDASFDRLPEALAGFFLDLGLFAGPFTAEAAAAVTGLANARGALEHLAQRSLVHRPTGPSDGYRLLPVVRLYAQERATADGRDQSAPRERFALYYAEQAAQFFEQFFQQPEAATRARQSWPNLIQAAAWATGPRAADLAYRLGWLSTEFGELDTALALYERVLTTPPTSPDLAARAHRSLGGIAHQRGQWEEAEARYQEAGQAFAQAHDLRGQATVRHEQARLRADRGDFAAADALYDETLSLFQQASDPYGEARTRYSRAVLARLRGEFARAGQDCEAVLATFRETGDRRMAAAALHELGYLAFVRGEYDQSRKWCQESLALKEELGARDGIAITLHNLGEVYAAEGDLTTARHRQEQAAEIFAQLGHRQGQAEAARELGRLDRLEGDPASAERRCQEALLLQERLSDRRGQAATLLELAALRQAQGRFYEALSLVTESLSLAEQAEDRLGQAHAPLRQAEVLAATGDLPGALAAAWESWRRYTALGAAGAERARQVLQTLRTRLGETFEEVWAATRGGAPPEWLASAIP
jgi:tetratricopeptide (TPR) repeat protein